MTDAGNVRAIDRGTVFATVDGELPGVGTVTYRYRNSDLAVLEDRLLELGSIEYTPPDEDRIDGVEYPVRLEGWDALEAWIQLRPFRVVPLLTFLGLRHDGWTEDELDERLAPSAISDSAVVQPMIEALAKAMGKDRTVAPAPGNRAARRKSAAKKAPSRAGSTGASSRTAGASRSSSAGSANRSTPSATPPLD